MAIKSANNPRARGRLSVITGMRLACMEFAERDDLAGLVKSVPQTWQRRASSLTLVPHVGHNLVGFEGVSKLIICLTRAFLVLPVAWRIIPENQPIRPDQDGILFWMELVSVYLHIPFCQHRCAYCDFNTYAGLNQLIPDYVEALCLEIETVAASASDLYHVHTIYFGGGTPSLLPASDIDKILATLRLCFHVLPSAEITLEANPGTLKPGDLDQIREAGVNRLSLGMQSVHPDELRLLEREHDFFDVAQAVHWARRAGFENINLDLIFGLPDQPIERWQKSLEYAVGLSPSHLSLYALTLEHGTPMEKWVGRGILSLPDPDAAAEMYEWAGEYLISKGFHQYEISNWAKGDDDHLLVCQHNLQYWRLEPYLGFGAGAHGFINGIHTANVLSPIAYIQRLSSARHSRADGGFPLSAATLEATHLSKEDEMKEVMLMGLRLTEEGIHNDRFEERFGISLVSAYGPVISGLVDKGLIEWVDEKGRQLRLTQKGRLLGNLVFVEFV